MLLNQIKHVIRSAAGDVLGKKAMVSIKQISA